MKVQRKYSGAFSHALVLEAESSEESQGLAVLREAVRFWVPGSKDPNGNLSAILVDVERRHAEQLAAEEKRRLAADPMPPELGREGE